MEPNDQIEESVATTTENEVKEEFQNDSVSTDMESKIELPMLTETLPDNPHISLVIISDAIKQATKNLEELDNRFRTSTDQLQQVQSMRIATTAQKNMLSELYQKIIELDKFR